MLKKIHFLSSAKNYYLLIRHKKQFIEIFSSLKPFQIYRFKQKKNMSTNIKCDCHSYAIWVEWNKFYSDGMC